MFKTIKKQNFLVYLIVMAGLLFSCAKETSKDTVALSSVDDAYLQGSYLGTFGGMPVTFTFKSGGGLDLLVELPGNDLEVKNGHYEIIRKGADTRMILMTGAANDYLVWLVTSMVTTSTDAQSSSIRTKVATKLNIKDGSGNICGTVACFNDFTIDHPFSGITAGQLATGDLSSVAFPVFIDGAFTEEGKRGLVINFFPASAFFNTTEATADADLRTALLITNSPDNQFRDGVNAPSSQGIDYIQISSN